jgi:chorismate synthase
MSIYGNFFKITTFGESHSKAVGVVIENFPSNFNINLDAIQHQLNRRKPGQSDITTPRNESDTFTVLSGIENNKSLGSPICFMVPNIDQRPEDYKYEEYIPRPSHADLTYLWKYGIHAASGGGRSSARETIGRVIGGALAEQILNFHNIEIIAYVSQVGSIKLDKPNIKLSRDLVDKFKTRCPDEETDKEMQQLILELKNNGNSVGGKINCIIKNCPKGLGEPVFNRLEAELAKAMLSIPATKGFEIGSGFKCVEMNGSNHNDPWIHDGKTFVTETNNNGGVIGGISNGQDIYFSVAFKPPATILMEQTTVNLKGDTSLLTAKGRHDPCVVPRAIPIVEAMTALVLIDLLYCQTAKLNILNTKTNFII